MFSSKKSLSILLDSFSLINYSCPSHFWLGAKPSLINIALTNNPKKIKAFAHFLLILQTHHEVILLSYSITLSKSRANFSFSSHDYEKINYSKLFKETTIIHWTKFYEINDINTKIEIFHEIYFSLFNENVPISKVKIKSTSKPWFTKEVNILMKIRKYWFDRWKANINNNDSLNCRNEYKSMCKIVKKRR